MSVNIILSIVDKILDFIKTNSDRLNVALIIMLALSWYVITIKEKRIAYWNNNFREIRDNYIILRGHQIQLDLANRLLLRQCSVQDQDVMLPLVYNNEFIKDKRFLDIEKKFKIRTPSATVLPN